jgi:hypothetical protein
LCRGRGYEILISIVGMDWTAKFVEENGKATEAK